MAAIVIPVVFPITLSSTDPVCATESARLLADRIVELREQMAKLLGLPLDTPITQALNFGAGLMGSRNQDSRYIDNTHFRLNADEVLTGSLAPGFIRWPNPGAITNDLGLGGPLPNTRDQAAAFPANSFVHLYWITNGTLLATLSSLAPPYPGPGPVLPPGYVLGAYAGATLLDASGFLVPSNIRGRWTQFKAARQVAPATTYSTGALQSISVATAVPSNAELIRANVGVVKPTSGGAVNTIFTTTLYDGLEDELGTVVLEANGFAVQEMAVSGVLQGPQYGQVLKITVPPPTAGASLVATVKVIAFQNPSLA